MSEQEADRFHSDMLPHMTVIHFRCVFSILSIAEKREYDHLHGTCHKKSCNMSQKVLVNRELLLAN